MDGLEPPLLEIARDRIAGMDQRVPALGQAPVCSSLNLLSMVVLLSIVSGRLFLPVLVSAVRVDGRRDTRRDRHG